MKPRLPKRIITFEESIPKVLIIGEKNHLTMKLVEALEKRDCLVFVHDRVIPDLPKIDYLFQFGKPLFCKKLLEKALQDNARYLFIAEKKNLNDFEKAVKHISTFEKKIDCRLLTLKTEATTTLAVQVNQILKAMFGRKKPFPLGLRSERKEAPKKTALNLAKIKLPGFNIAGLFFSFLILLIIFSPYLFFVFCLFQGGQSLLSFKKFFWEGDLDQAVKKAEASESHFLKAQKIADFLPFINKGAKLADFGKMLSQTAFSGAKLAIISQRASQIVLEEERAALSPRLEQLKLETESLERQLSLMTVFFDDLNLKKIEAVGAFSLGKKVKEVREALFSLKEVCSLIKKSLPLADELLGLNGERVYFVLFHNNMELRPGGGFIGSFGLAHFKDGVFTELETYDVYTADGQLKGHVDPPEPIRKYLGQPHFFLRDSNFSPDFAVNAQQAAWFLKKEMKQEVDGVIGVDLTFVQKLLEALGGVNLADYQQKITAENLFLKAQVLIETDFFPGSTKKKDFLGSLSRGIFNRLKTGNLPWFKIAQSLKQGLEEKHLQIFLFNQEAQELVEELGWAGRVPAVSCQQSVVSCFPDYLMIVEANLGVNKANYFVKKEISLVTDFSEKKISHQLIINYQNTSPGQTFPGGRYKNYLRVFVPKNAVLERVMIENQSINFNQIKTEEEEDKKNWGVLVEIPALTRKKISFIYYQELPTSFSKARFSYELVFQKQAGTEKNPLFLKFKFPQSWKVEKTNFPVVVKNADADYTTDLSVDRVFSVEFSR